MALHCTLAEFKLWASDNVTHFTNAQGTSFDSMATDLLTAASRQIELDTGRQFSTATETRILRVDVDGYVRFRDLITATTVLVDQNTDDTPETAAAASDYLLGPLTDDSGATAVRYQWMRARRNSSVRLGIGWWVSIAGSWGYVESAAAPGPIKVATYVRAAWLLARRDAALGTVAIPGMGVAASMQQWDADYRALIGPYIHPWTQMPGGG